MPINVSNRIKSTKKKIFLKGKNLKFHFPEMISTVHIWECPSRCHSMYVNKQRGGADSREELYQTESVLCLQF